MSIETAVPAFIGYTERAESSGGSVANVPVRIASMTEFEQCFGRGVLDVVRPLFSLHTSLRLFYANGGGPCYIVSAGSYAGPLTSDALLRGLDALKDTAGPTLLVIPDASLLPVDQYGDIARAMMKQAHDRQDRIALLDVPHVRSFQSSADPAFGDAIAAFRASVGNDNLSYGVAYIPYLTTTIVKAARQSNLLPASAAMAGVMTAVDNARGVWTAPANIALNAVDRPAFSIDDETQADLNKPLDGKAINVIREFAGRGSVVWGARTLDGNSLDYRYVHVRRTVIYIEQSIKAAIKPFVSAPNDTKTWASVVAAVSGFLQQLWAGGGLMGATAQEAFAVNCGVGATMTAQDVLEGDMIVQVLVALVHDGEFIDLTFKQKMEAPR